MTWVRSWCLFRPGSSDGPSFALLDRHRDVAAGLARATEAIADRERSQAKKMESVGRCGSSTASGVLIWT